MVPRKLRNAVTARRYPNSILSGKDFIEPAMLNADADAGEILAAIGAYHLFGIHLDAPRGPEMIPLACNSTDLHQKLVDVRPS